MLGRLLGGETRAVTYQSVWGTGGDWPTGETWAGSTVSQSTSLQIAAVYSCVRLYTDTLSTLPVGAYLRAKGTRRPFYPRPSWLDTPYPGVTWGNHVQQGMVSLLINGNWYTRVYRNSIGEAVALLVLDPNLVEPMTTADGDVVYVWDGGRATIPSADMLHITELVMPGQVKGVSRIDQVKQELGLSQALTEFAARFFANGTAVGGIIQTEAAVTVEQAKAVKSSFEATHKGAGKAHGVAVIGGGGKFVPTSTAPEEAQMLESRAQQIETIARVFRVPPPKIGITTPGSMSYASVEQLQISWTQDSVRPYAAKIEDAYSRLLPETAFIRLNMDALLRGDTESRYNAYSTALQSGWASINDVRRLEDMPPVDGGDGVRVPLANVDLAAANVVETEKNVAMAVALIAAGADPAETLAAFGLPAIEFAEPETPDAPEPADPADDPAEDDTEDTPTRTIRSVIRDDAGFITAIVDEEL